jgi:hypothetical protein
MADKEKKVQGPTIRWDDSKMTSTYANVCNVSSTREEITLLFGLNQAWNAQQKQLTIELSDRIILNPYAAKRMANLLNNVLSQYEERFGEIGQGNPEAEEAAKAESH